MVTRKSFIVCYDYGMGSIWLQLEAESETEIVAAYPELDVYDTRPAWMLEREAAELPEYSLSAPPQGFLNVILESRERARWLTGRDRPVFTVGATKDGVTRWQQLRATTEVAVLDKYPEVVFRHGRDPDWVKIQRNANLLDPVVYDLDDLASGMPLLDAIDGVH